jgi:hypothetical protein
MADSAKSKRPMKSAKQAVDRFNEAWTYAKTNHHSRWDRNHKLYNNKRHNPGYKGITNTFVPMSFSTVETITAALCAGKPSIDFAPQNMYKYIETYAQTGKKPDLKALNAQYDYFWDCDNWDLKTIMSVRMILKLGVGTEWIHWDGDKPRVINLNPRDAIIDPALTDPMQLWTNPDDYYTGRRYFTTVDALKKVEILDPATGEFKKKFKNLDKINPGALTADDKADQSIGALGDHDVEVVEVWDGKRIVSVAQRQVTIESRDNPLGIHSLAIGRFIADENIIYGKAILDPIAAPQELLNDVTNQRTDAVTDMLQPERELDPMYASWLPKMKNAGPGTIYPFKPGSMTIIAKPQTNIGAFQETTNIKNEMREATGSDQTVSGVTQDQQTTATEVRAKMNQAGERFSLYVRMLERELLYQRTKIVFKMMLHYMQDKTLVPVNSMDGPKFRHFNPADFDDTYEPQIRLEASVQADKSKDQGQAAEAYKILIQDPTNDLWEAKKILYPKMFDLSEEELDRIIGTEKPVADPLAGAAGGDPMATGAQPQGEVNPLAHVMGGVNPSAAMPVPEGAAA